MSVITTAIVLKPIATLRAASRNPRTHNKKQVRKIADSITRFGFVTPILIDAEGRIVSGHGRWAAAKLLGLPEVPTLTVDHLSPEELRAFALADNQLATLASWDKELLSIEMNELSELVPELDLTLTGFELEHIEILRDVAGARRRSKAKSVPEPLPSSDVAVTQIGDLWAVGEHRLLCGDATSAQSYRALLDAEIADLVISDPPYNVPIAGHVSGMGEITHREFEMASGEMSREQFQRFLSQVCRCLAGYSRSGSLHYLFMDWRSITDLIGAGEEHYDELLNIIVWVKPTGGMGSLYRSRHEFVALFRNGSRSHTNNIELGTNGRNRTNVWEYSGANAFGPDRALTKLHPTVKNVEMIADAIRDASGPGEMVLDPFGGSGTTLIAAERAARRSRLMELDPLYCDTILRRALSEGLAANLVATGESFLAVQDRRAEIAPLSSACPHA